VHKTKNERCAAQSVPEQKKIDPHHFLAEPEPKLMCYARLRLLPSSDIFRLENLSVWKIPVFRYGLLMRN
jgi:hypothetical protein